MTLRQQTWLVLLVVFLLGAGVAAGWYVYWPRFHRDRQLALAEKSLAANDLEGAEAILRPLARNEPDHLRTQLLFAQVLRRMGRLRDAVGPLGLASKLGLPEDQAKREFALIESHGHFPKVENLLLGILHDHPTDSEVLEALAQGYARRGRWYDAERVYTQWLEADPARQETRFERGTVRAQARMFEKAAEDFHAVVERDPANFQAHLMLANCLLNDALIASAQAELQTCRQLRPERSEPFVGLAKCAIERQEWDQARDLLVKALSLDPKSPLALGELANFYMLRKRYDLAVGTLNQLLVLTPRDKQAHLNLAQALRFQGKLEEAQEHSRRYQELEDEENEKFRRK
jgi:tetratricopeptide (TPR) repeat protein